jgi:hypothetical protein
LEKLALKFGYIQERGAGAGRLGSMSALVRAIASGAITLVSKERGGQRMGAHTLRDGADAPLYDASEQDSKKPDD